MEIIPKNVKSWCWEGDGLGGLREHSIPGDIAHHTGMVCEKCECGKAALASAGFMCLRLRLQFHLNFPLAILHARCLMQQA